MTTQTPLIQSLANAGLIQFGRFEHSDGIFWPVMVNLRWLPSYPTLLSETAAVLHPLLDQIKADRLLTTVDALPVGVALSLRANRPLVYPYGEVRDYTAAFAIEGAYDVGHPTALLSDVLIDAPQANAITTVAQRVGLNVNAILAVIDLGLGAHDALKSTGYTVHTALTLRDMLPVLVDQGVLPPAMYTTVEKWQQLYGA